MQRHFSAGLQDKLTIIRGRFPGKKDANSSLSRIVRKMIRISEEKSGRRGRRPLRRRGSLSAGPDVSAVRKKGASRRGSRCMYRSHSNDAPPGGSSQVGSRSTVPSRLNDASPLNAPQVGSGSTVPSRANGAVHSLRRLHVEQQLMNALRFSLSQWTGE